MGGWVGVFGGGAGSGGALVLAITVLSITMSIALLTPYLPLT